MKTLYLKKNEERRIKAGHLWVFSNEVDTRRSPLKEFEAGEAVRIHTPGDNFLAHGYVNPGSLICARVVSRDKGEPFGPELVGTRMEQALAMRHQLFTDPYYRVVFGEGDRLPGLVIDRFDDLCAIQITTAGMERIRPDLQDLVVRILNARGIVWRDDIPARRLEGLAGDVQEWGEVPESAQVLENGGTFSFPLRSGQKTGWFYDQRSNRASFAAHCRGRRVLDVFSYVGGTAVLAARDGAEHVTCIDASDHALEYVEINSRLQGMEDRIETVQGNGFDLLEEMAGEKYGAVMLDPPAFIKRKKDFSRGKAAYEKLNSMALSMVEEEGVFMSCSCSQHLSMDGLIDIVRQAGLRAKRTVRILEKGTQGPDHPVHPAMPETAYLKCLLCWVT